MNLFTDLKKHDTLAVMPIVEANCVNFKGDLYKARPADEMIGIAQNALTPHSGANCDINDYTNFYQLLNSGVADLSVHLEKDFDALRTDLANLCLFSNALRDTVSFVIDARLSSHRFDKNLHAGLFVKLDSLVSQLTYWGLKMKFDVLPSDGGGYEFNISTVINRQEILLIEGCESGFENLCMKELKTVFVMLNSIKAFIEHVKKKGFVEFKSPVFLQMNDVYWDIELNTPDTL